MLADHQAAERAKTLPFPSITISALYSTAPPSDTAASLYDANAMLMPEGNSAAVNPSARIAISGTDLQSCDGGGCGTHAYLAAVSNPAAPHERQLVRLRIIEAMREIGVFLMAFSPLDVALGSKPLAESARVLAGFLLAGIVLFSLSVRDERRLDGG